MLFMVAFLSIMEYFDDSNGHDGISLNKSTMYFYMVLKETPFSSNFKPQTSRLSNKCQENA